MEALLQDDRDRRGKVRCAVGHAVRTTDRSPNTHWSPDTDRRSGGPYFDFRKCLALAGSTPDRNVSLNSPRFEFVLVFAKRRKSFENVVRKFRKFRQDLIGQVCGRCSRKTEAIEIVYVLLAGQSFSSLPGDCLCPFYTPVASACQRKDAECSKHPASIQSVSSLRASQHLLSMSSLTPKECWQ